MGPFPLSTLALSFLFTTGIRGAGPYARQATEPTPTPTSDSHDAVSSQELTALSDCHLHETEVFCMAGATEYIVHASVTATEELPAAFTDCHSHGSETFCVGPNGDDVAVALAAEEEADDHDDHDDHDDQEGEDESEQHCHFHAGIEHCTGGASSSTSEEAQCSRVDRDYNIPLRVGLLFVVLATSSIGVFGPILLERFLPSRLNGIIVVLKQFGTGVIISTVFVHLFTHAMLMFANECLGDLQYESTAAAILMAGLFVSFLIEYIGQRYIQLKRKRASEAEGSALVMHHGASETVTISVMEAGIIFHSLLIGLTLAVAGDGFFLTLFAVIVFHQFFEGVALGSRLATVGFSKQSSLANIGCSHHFSPHDPVVPGSDDSRSGSIKERSHDHQTGEVIANHEESVVVGRTHFPMWKKLLYAAAFAVVTPAGMAIGIGVLNKFNGNDPTTIIVIGSLDAFSAGILIWVGVVEMWAADWMGGEMSTASPLMTGLGMTGLVGGMVLMSALGKWA